MQPLNIIICKLFSFGINFNSIFRYDVSNIIYLLFFFYNKNSKSIKYYIIQIIDTIKLKFGNIGNYFGYIIIFITGNKLLSN